MCIFPKWFEFNRKEPPIYPFPRHAEANDCSHFNPAYFQHFDALILELRRIGVQADLILFHPYDKWGYQSMPADVNERLSAPRDRALQCLPKRVVVAGQ